MESFLIILPTLYCYLSGILIAWGAAIAYKQIKILSRYRNIHSKNRKEDIIQTMIILSATFSMITTLFIIPQYLPYFLEMLFLTQLWYTIFLFYSTLATLNIENKIKQIDKLSTSLVSTQG